MWGTVFRLYCLALLLFAANASSFAHAAKFGFNLELGSELDSNSLRTTQRYDPVQSTLLRFAAQGLLRGRWSNGHLLSLTYAGGGKYFLAGEARDADELVHRAVGSWAKGWRNGVRLLTSFDYYDSFQRGSERDFRNFGGLASLSFPLSDHPQRPNRYGRLEFEFDYHGIQFKPDVNYSFDSFSAELGWSIPFITGPRDALVDWRFRVSYEASMRIYRGRALREDPECGVADLCIMSTNEQRWDHGHIVRGAIEYQGNAHANLWVSTELNRSNSYGERYLRHIVGLKFTTVVIWKIYMTALGALQFSQFEDQIFGQTTSQTFVSIDDENRSRFTLQLARSITDRWSIIARYGLFLNESSRVAAIPVPGFLRHTAMLGIRYEWGELL